MNETFNQVKNLKRMLSIVTVTRNDAVRLAQTIKSLERFYGDSRFEHIVMDGRSTDDTHLLAASVSHNANFQFHSGSDKGIYDAMNQGVAKSDGRFLLFLNCGDCMRAGPDDVATWIEQVGEEKNIDIACFSFAQIESGGHTKIVHVGRPMRSRMPTSHQAMLFFTDFIRSHPYNISYKIAADYDLYTRSRPQFVVIAPTQAPLTAVEVDGVASSQPMISYGEYLKIASRNLRGIEMLLCMASIGLKAMTVIAVKSVLPSKWVSKIRKIL